MLVAGARLGEGLGIQPSCLSGLSPIPPAGSFTAEDKESIAKGMTELYTSVGLPAFYCHTHFFELPPESIYAGGERQTALTLISIHHVARSFDTPEIKDFFFSTLDKILRPILKLNGIEWELSIVESSRDYWRINGLVPPQTDSDMEKKWFAANKVTDEEEMSRHQSFRNRYVVAPVKMDYIAPVKSRKRRTKPRISELDAQAVNRRRAQVSAAQRAYRQRKEHTIESLTAQVDNLQGVITSMNSCFHALADKVVSSQWIQHNLQASKEVKEIVDEFLRIREIDEASSHEAPQSRTQGNGRELTTSPVYARHVNSL
ncbi:hypothetical protein V502_10185, partial [Pseudogymnoascus sp. VKM F-4520 (FW-2644)]